ncbi:MAG: hypothetical protein QHJ82_10770 [Verrucomicrobiota bacterium]|nr:hypothetical protein [Verrucomicrobiota bacterium]
MSSVVSINGSHDLILNLEKGYKPSPALSATDIPFLTVHDGTSALSRLQVSEARPQTGQACANYVPVTISHHW